MRKLLVLYIVLTSLIGCIGIEQRGVEPLPQTNTAESAPAADGTSGRANTLIQLRDPLDEPEYYCVDVPGFGRSLNLDGVLTAHTCKPNADDELFIIDHRQAGQLYMPAYDRCVQARGGRGWE